MKTIILDSTSKKLQLKLGGAVTTHECDWVTSYADDNGTTFIEGSSDGVSSGASTVDIVASPAASTRRVVKGVSVYNRDTVPVVLSILYYNGSSSRIIDSITLDVDEEYTLDCVFQANGSIKTGSVTPYTFATGTEIDAGNVADKMISPYQFSWSNEGLSKMEFKITQDGTTFTTGTAKLVFMVPMELDGWYVVRAAGFVSTVGSTATTVNVRNLMNSGLSIFTTTPGIRKIVIDGSLYTSYASALPPVINITTNQVHTGDLLAIDINTVGTGSGGLGVYLAFRVHNLSS